LRDWYNTVALTRRKGEKAILEDSNRCAGRLIPAWSKEGGGDTFVIYPLLNALLFRVEGGIAIGLLGVHADLKEKERREEGREAFFFLTEANLMKREGARKSSCLADS